MTRIVGILLRQGWKRGVLGGSRPWLLAGAAALTVSMLQRLCDRDGEVVLHEELHPGEALVIRHLGSDGEAPAGL